MPARKRIAPTGDSAEPIAKRRSSRHAAVAVDDPEKPALKKSAEKPTSKGTKAKSAEPSQVKASKPATKAPKAKPAAKPGKAESNKSPEQQGSRSVSEDPDVNSILATNPEAPRHDGEWYWLMKAEPETRIENGIDVRFSIDDLRAKEKPEGWDGIRAYAARNHMRNMNVGDKAFFYHSNCKEPGIVGIMEIVREFSEDKSARRPGTPYYDAASTKDKPRWSLVHVEFRSKFAVPIYLKEMREMGAAGGPLADMMMLKQSRLSVSRVSGDEWKALCEVADRKAKEAGSEHET